MARVNILKEVKDGGRWKLVSIPRKKNGRYDWKALPDGRYLIEWYEAGRRRRQAAGRTVSQALEAQRRKRHFLEGRVLGIEGFEEEELTAVVPPLHLSVRRYLDLAKELKKPNTFRKYRAVLERFLQFFSSRESVNEISEDDLNDFMIHLKQDHGLGNNSVVHNLIIVAQFMKKAGKGGMTKRIDLPTKMISLPEEYTDDELEQFFPACSDAEHTLFLTYLLTGFREQEVMYLFWEDIRFDLSSIRVRKKPAHGFYPKRWEEREVPVKKRLIEKLKNHPKRRNCPFVFPSPRGNRDLHMLDKAKAVAERAGLAPSRFTLKKFRSTFATRMLRTGFDVRTVQYWMGHKSLETTMRYLSPAQDVHDRLDQKTGIFDEL